MNPTQQRLSAEIAELDARLDSLVSMEADDTQLEERMAQIESVQADLEKRRAQLTFEDKVAEKRASFKEVRSITPPVPVKKEERAVKTIELPRHMKELRGFKDPTEAYHAGRYLQSMALRGNFTGADEVSHSMGENEAVYANKGAELVQHGSLYGGILGLLSYDSLMVRLGMNLGQIIGDTITVPRSDADIDADFIAENTEIPPVIIPTGGVKGIVSGIKARCQTSRELVADASESGAITIASLVANKFARAFNMRLDKTWLNGSPAAKANIDGILTKADGTTSNLPSGHEITQATIGKITVEEIISVLSALNQHSRNVAWLVHPTAWGQVMSAAKSIMGADLDSPVPMELLGSPVYKCEAMPDTHLLVAIDGEQATQFGFKRNGLEIQASYDRAIEYWQVVWAACLRVVIINSGLTYAAALKKKV